MLDTSPEYKKREAYLTATALIQQLRTANHEVSFVATKAKVPFTDQDLLIELWGACNTPDDHFSKDAKICVFYTVELAVYLASKGYTDITVVTAEADDLVVDCLGEFDEFSHIKYHVLSSLNKNMKFDIAIGNPPYQNGTNKKFYKQFLSVAKNIADVNAFVIPMSFFRDISNLNGVRVFKSLGDAFETVQMGVCYFVRECGYEGPVKMIDRENRERFSSDTPAILCENLADYDVACKVVDKANGGYEVQSGALLRREKSATGGIKCIISTGRSNGDFDWTLTDDAEKVNGLLLHKVVMSAAGDVTKIGCVKYAGPEWGCGASAIFIEVASKEQAERLIAYFESEVIKFLCKIAKFGDFHNTPKLFKSIPRIDLSRDWSAEDLSVHFGLTAEDVNYIIQSNADSFRSKKKGA